MVVILGLASAVIVPQISSRDDLKVSSAARTLVADLIYAQNMAITKQQMYYVRFDAANERYTVLSAVSPDTIVTRTRSRSSRSSPRSGPTARRRRSAR